MSYILDALNKSEKERARKRAPDLSSLKPDERRESFGGRHFIVILLLLIVINFLGIWYFFGDRVVPPTRPVTPVLTTTLPENTLPAPELPTTRPEATTPLRIEELPADIRARMPDIEVTTHIFAQDSTLRMVKIGGVERQEGDQVQANLQLVEITETGVVMEFEGYRYSLDIVEDWQVY